MKDRIAAFVREESYKPMTAAELAEALKVPPKQAGQLETSLARLEAAGLLVRNRTGRYGAPERMNLAVGRIQGHPRGFAFLTPEVQPPGTEGDVFIGRENLAGALHEDRVVVRLAPPAREGARREGEVIRILERGVKKLVGRFDGNRAGGYVTPDDPRFPEDILVPRGQAHGARAGEKVVIKLTRWPEARRPAEGSVVERLGPAGDPGVDILSIVRAHDLPEAFPPKVLQEAEAAPGDIPPDEYDRRVDLRPLPVITIDGEDARDLDDAVCVQQKGPDRWRLWVSIADVGWYVREGSLLDREALRRGTSVYLADRVIPMLPPRLSADLCSLNPGVDRLTVTCEMEIDRRGRVVSHQIYPSVIRSQARMTYQQVARLLEDADADLTGRFRELLPLLREMRTLMEVLRERRLRRGSLDFELPEARLVLGDAGQPLDVQRSRRTVADQLIEEFMLVANETVAEHFARMKVPFVYRVHEAPSAEKLAGLAEFLALFGYRFQPGPGGVTPADLQAVTTWAAGRPEAALLETVILRSLPQARYSPDSPGHFGLAAAYYCHFTSPIRRYPDLVIHRIARELWERKGSLTAKRRTRLEQLTREAALQSSVRERLAVEAERETHDLKKAQFMQERLGEAYGGVISGVTHFGFFVQLPNTVEGLVHVSTLDDDYYLFSAERYALVGQRTRRTFRLGDPVTVRVTGVDLARRSIDLALVDAPASLAAATADAPRRAADAPRRTADAPRRTADAPVAPPRPDAQAPAAAPRAPAPATADEAAVPPPAAADPAAEAGRRTRRRRRKPEGDAARAGKAAAPAAAAPTAAAPTAAPTAAAPTAAPTAAAPTAAAPTAAAPTAAAPKPEPAATQRDAAAPQRAQPAPRRGRTARKGDAAQKGGAARKEDAAQKGGAARKEDAAPKRPAAGAKTDMWGIPVPADRPHLDDEDEPDSPRGMFSLAPGTERSSRAEPRRRKP